MNADSRLGRNQFLLATGSMICALLLVALGVWLRGAEFKPLTQLGRPVVFAVLAIAAYRGTRWARILLAVWSGLLALTFGVVAINAGFESPLWTVIALAFMIGAVYVTYLLAASPAIDAFVATQRVPNDASRPAA